MLTITSFTMISCKDQPDKYEIADGTPTVYYVRSPYASQKDSLMTGAYMGNTVCLVGDNLRSIAELYFNDQQAVLNTSFITDHTLLCDVPKNLPNNPTDKIYMKTKSGQVVEFDFAVLVPSATVSSMSNEYAKEGETVTIYGDYLLDYADFPIEIMMPGDVKVTDIVSADKTSATFVIPTGATESGYITVKTKYGTSKSKFYYRDDRGMILDWDGSHGGLELVNGWRSGDLIKVNDGTGIDGAFIRFKGQLSENGWGNDENDFSFNYWANGTTSGTPISQMNGCAELFNKYKLSQLALKFEHRIPSSKAWKSSGIQMVFTKQGVTDTNGYYWDETIPRGIWALYSSNGSYDTGGEWRTASISLTNFNKKHTGEACENELTIEDIGGLSFYFMGGPAGVASELQMDVDNIRIAPTE